MNTTSSTSQEAAKLREKMATAYAEEARYKQLRTVAADFWIASFAMTEDVNTIRQQAMRQRGVGRWARREASDPESTGVIVLSKGESTGGPFANVGHIRVSRFAGSMEIHTGIAVPATESQVTHRPNSREILLGTLINGQHVNVQWIADTLVTNFTDIYEPWLVSNVHDNGRFERIYSMSEAIPAYLTTIAEQRDPIIDAAHDTTLNPLKAPLF
jgi:hypothetical protein